VSDEGQLQVSRTGGGNSLTIPGACSSLAARGMRDADIVATASQTAAGADEPGEICWWCGERKELASDGAEEYGYCRWCSSREQEIRKIWNKWGFGASGTPESDVWDADALHRDEQAKREIDKRLEEFEIGVSWVDLGFGFNRQGEFSQPCSRGLLQAYHVAEGINCRLAMDATGRVIRDDDTTRQADFGTEVLKKLLSVLGAQQLPDSWSGWSRYEPVAFPAFEAAVEGNLYWKQRTCGRCGKLKELVLGGRVCAACGDGLDRQWRDSAATDWILMELRNSTVHEYLYENTAYARMRARWASQDGNRPPWRSRAPSDDEIFLMKSLWGVWVKPSAPDLICSWIRPAKPEERSQNSAGTGGRLTPL
jgi:hypothetical protein